MTANTSMKDLLAGLIFMAIGLSFGYAALGYNIGTALRMGPAYFPLILAGILTILGLVILVQSLTAGPDEIPMERVPWKGLVLITAGLVFFGVTVRGLGMAPALFVTTFLSAFASNRTGVAGALIIAAILTALCVLIFNVALGLPLPIIGRWLNF
jgi:hypothetical protein